MKIEARHDVAAVTICAANYLGKAAALRKSYLEFHPDSDFYIVVIEKKTSEIKAPQPDSQIIWAEDLGIEGFLHYALKFDVIELSTNVKPFTLRMLLSNYKKVLYLDPDIFFYSRISSVFDELAQSPIVITPHALSPIGDGKSPSDLEFMKFGAFNLGFIGVARSDEAFRFLEWWSKRCLDYGYYEPQLGLAVDQKWIDLAPSFFGGVKILRDPGLNVAFWNLHERTLTQPDGHWLINSKYPLRFFHFSSFNGKNPRAIAQKQSRFAVGSRPDLHELLDSYAAELGDCASEAYSSIDYSFDRFDDGMYVTPTLRRFYAALESRFPQEENPFLHGSLLQKFAIKNGLASKRFKRSQRSTFKEMGKFAVSARIISIALRTALRIVGPIRYFTLMRYIAHISSIRNQSDILGERSVPTARSAPSRL